MINRNNYDTASDYSSALDSEIFAESERAAEPKHYLVSDAQEADISSDASLFDFEIMSESAKAARDAMGDFESELTPGDDALSDSQDAPKTQLEDISEYAYRVLHENLLGLK
ncbi:MAG: hypothetical protein LBI43_02430 [Streptococcaceae bacterium]|jgi:hypothetical protein|nr:hypothetical protein [Streptococcaceae bacterium]